MKLVFDEARFDARQLFLMEKIVETLLDGLRSAGVDDSQTLHDATSDMAFSLACILDGSRIMELDGEPVLPFIGFANERDGDEIVVSEAGTWMHEYSHGTVSDVFDRE